MRTIVISDEKGIRALYCVDDKVNITYIFDADKWSMAEAQAWVRDHKATTTSSTGTINSSLIFRNDSTEAPSQDAVKDELDYVLYLVRQDDMSDESREMLRKIAAEIIERLPGSDIPVSILAKAGAVLSAKNKNALKQAQELIQSVLDSAEPAQEAYRPGEIARLVAQTIKSRTIGR